MRGFALWWRQPDHYAWLTGYLEARSLTAHIRYILAGILSMLSLATLLMMFSPAGPHDTAGRVVCVGVVGGLFAIGVGFAWRWPSRARSRAFAVWGAIAIAAACLADTDPRAGMLGCTAFIGLVGYVGFFHCAHFLSLTLAISMVASIGCAVRISAAGDPALALSRLLVMVGGILVVPLCGQALVHWLSVDALKSSTDALTGLRNRRGFHRAASDLVARVAAESGRCRCLTVVMVDLDAFKQVNDTYGHAIGDMVLVAVADRLREASGDDAVVGRIGGEEFLVAVTRPPDEVAAIAERLLAAIAAMSWNVTASLGVASTGLSGVAENYRELISGLTIAADSAMYAAKRAGGNQIRHSDTPKQ